MLHKEKRKRFINYLHEKLSPMSLWKKDKANLIFNEKEKEMNLNEMPVRYSFGGGESKEDFKNDVDDMTVCSDNMMETDSRDRSSSMMSHESDGNSSIFSPHPCRSTAVSPVPAPPLMKSKILPFLSQSLFHSKNKPPRQLSSAATLSSSTQLPAVPHSLPSELQEKPQQAIVGLYEFFEDSDQEEEEETDSEDHQATQQLQLSHPLQSSSSASASTSLSIERVSSEDIISISDSGPDGEGWSSNDCSPRRLLRHSSNESESDGWEMILEDTMLTATAVALDEGKGDEE
jgi:hypothetical protein